MSNVALATGGTYRPKGGSAFDRRRSGGKVAARPALCLAVFGIVVLGSSLSWWQSVDASDGASVAPRHLDVDAFARGGADYGRHLSRRARDYLAAQTYDERGRAKPRNGGQFSSQDRRLALAVLGEAPKNVLVFGTPPDGPFWAETNGEGRTVFLEDNAPKLDKALAAGLEAARVAYHTVQRDWLDVDVLDPADPRLKIDGAAEVLASADFWDLVVVDAPDGMHKSSTGRAAPIAAAARLLAAQRAARPGRATDVLVHDAHRAGEFAWALHALAPHARFVNAAALAASRRAGDAAARGANASATPVVEFAWFHAD